MRTQELIELEEKLGRIPTDQEIKEFEFNERQQIKKYANHHLWTDVNPYEVVRTISPICVEVREMNAVQTKHPQDFHPGGFVGHFSDNRSGQDYEYSSNPEAPVFRIRFSRARGYWYSADHSRFLMSDTPYKFYDYNF